jgi:hypothetical protein
VSARAVQRVLWLLLVATIPVRYQLADSELAPTLRLVFLTAITLLLHLSEGYGGKLWATLLAIGLAQSVLYLLLFYALAAFAARQLTRRVGPRVALAFVAAVALLLLAGAALLRPYVTPISSQTMYSGLFDALR